jgi:hypothetical protein
VVHGHAPESRQTRGWAGRPGRLASA